MAYVIETKTDAKGSSEYATLIANEEEFRALRNQEKQLRILNDVRAGNDNEKKHLLSIMYQGHPLDDGAVKGSDRPSRSYILDIDDEGEAERVITLLMSNIEKYNPYMIERSVNGGAHVVFPRPWAVSILEAQCNMALLLHTEIDLNNKNTNRKLFSTSADEHDLVYVNPELFNDTFDKEEWAREKAEMDARRPDLPDMPKKADKHYKPWEHKWPSHGIMQDVAEEEVKTSTQDRKAENVQDVRIYPTSYNGIAYDSIIAKYWEQNNAGNEPNEGNRNSLTFQLACDLAPICDYNQEWLEQIIPRYDGFSKQEWRQTISQALKEDKKGIRYRTRKAIEEAKKEMRITSVTGGSSFTPPSMPARLTRFQKILLSKTPELYHPTVCEAVFPALAAHLHGVTFRFIDGTIHEPHSFSLLVAAMSSGKGCINKPIEYIMADIYARDAESRKREAEWKRKNPSGSKKQPRPTDICIQSLMTDVTHAAFVLRLTDADANGQRAVYMHVDEVEMLEQIKGSGKGSSVFAYIKLAYDTSRIGQERVGAESIDGNAPLRWDCNASTTPAMARKYFRKAVYDGTLSRMNLNTIILPDDNMDIPVFGVYDDKYAENLKPYIERLNSASGEIHCPQALRLAHQLDKENKARALEYDNKAYERLSFRANVNAYVKAMILYILNDYKWSKDIEQYVRWSEQWDLWCKLRFFLDYIEADIAAEEGAVNHGPTNLIATLPAEFSYDDFLRFYRQAGKTGDGKATLRKWISRGYLEFNDNDNYYVKIGKYGKNG